MIVKSERNSIIQYSDRHSQMISTLSPQEISNKKAVTLRDSCMKESSLIELVSKLLLYEWLLKFVAAFRTIIGILSAAIARKPSKGMFVSHWKASPTETNFQAMLLTLIFL